MQAVVLCGGLGTRLGPLTRSRPKSLVPVAGRPFLDYQLDLLARSGFREVVLCIGHLGEQIRAYAGDGARWGLRLLYSDEGERRLGTGGALALALPLLRERFVLIYGDSYLPLDYPGLMARLEATPFLAVMAVFHNRDRYDRSNVVLEGERVAVYDKARRLPGMEYIDAGATALRREAVLRIPPGQPYPLEALLQALAQEGLLGAYRTDQRFYEVGSPQGLAEFEQAVRAGSLLGPSHAPPPPGPL